MAEEEDLSKLKVTDLKDLLKQSGLPVSGKKDNLIKRLQEHSTTGPVEDGTTETEEEVEQLPTESRVEVVAPEEAQQATNGPVAQAEPMTKDSEAVEDDGEPAAKRVKLDAEVEVQEIVALEDDEPPIYDFPPEEPSSRPTDMYLDTINRSALDFDFERLCSVTLSHNHIYACLCDGKYFQGRGSSSPAYAHALAEDHHVFINLTTLKVYVLPDGYEVSDPSLDDIKYLLSPTFTPSLLHRLDVSLIPSYDLLHQPYYPGFVGLQNIKANTYMNSILHALVHVPPLRDYFILSPLVRDSESELVKRFSLFCKKVWNPKAFKGQVSPHEVLQECANASEGRFKITKTGDPVEFLGWLLNKLHSDLRGSRKKKSSIIYSAFQGEIRVDDQQVLTTGEWGGKPRFDVDREIKSTSTPFLFLTLDLPPPPLFQSSSATNIVPQVSLQTLLAKYDGLTTQEAKGVLRRYKMTRLPPFLILHVKRFTKNNFVEEKNSTIVNFPLRGVEMQDYVDPKSSIPTYYDLLTNITHTSAAGTAREETTWKTQVHLRPPRDQNGQLRDGLTEEDEKWFEIQDLLVGEINQGMIALGESYIQIWERRTKDQRHELTVEPPKTKSGPSRGKV